MVFQMTYHTTAPYDDIRLISDGKVLTGLYFVGSSDEQKHPHDAVEANLPIFQETCRWLDIYFSGRQPDFVPAWRTEVLTPFRKDVQDIMLTIPYGETMTYGEIAQRLARKRGIGMMSAQAVGGAVGWNPICLIIPCHRVIGTNGKMTGYGGGIKNKQALLDMEIKL